MERVRVESPDLCRYIETISILARIREIPSYRSIYDAPESPIDNSPIKPNMTEERPPLETVEKHSKELNSDENRTALN